MKKIIKYAIVSLMLCFLVSGCGNKEKTIKDYKVFSGQSQEGTDAVAYLQTLIHEQYGKKPGTTDDTGRPYLLYPVSNEEFAKHLGYQPDLMQENSFVIKNIHESIYLFANNQDSMDRACQYFVKNLIDTDGNLLLKTSEEYIHMGTGIKKEITIGNVPIGEYDIVYENDDATDACRELRYYIRQTGKDYLDVIASKEAGDNRITLVIDSNLEAGKKEITITEGQVRIAASDKASLLKGTYLFVNTYLGWMFAGEEREQISGMSNVIRIPENVQITQPWIAEREAIITLWNVNFSRGFYLNGDVSLENNVMDFSEAQLYEYVKMLKHCGYTGIQVTEMCSAWIGSGGYEAVHDKIRTMADAAHSLDMKMTLWVWGAEFTGYGWVDNSVVYSSSNGEASRNCPEVIETFEKYYTIYAELADCCDRVIGHFYDPGNLTTAEDIAFFSKMLRDKMQAVNPDIDFGISCWVDVYDKNVFVRELGTNITLYECGHHDDEGTYNTFRSFVAGSGCRLGTWAWNTCEMEIDQLAQMNYNPEIIRQVYQTARNYDSVMQPSYWSEMDSYHVLNVFSLYCAGQLLINPDTDTEQLTYEIAEAAVGQEYAQALAQMLYIIQDARSGASWDTYLWRDENYILKSDAYPAEDILSRCNKYIPVLDEMIEKGIEANTLPLPIRLNQLLQMMRPHLVQIREFAEFRIALDEVREAYENGVDPESLNAMVKEISEPIKDYNVVIGAWGQIEARAQREMIAAFCEEAGLELPGNPIMDENHKRYIYGQFVVYQKGKKEPVYFAGPYYQYGLGYYQKDTERLVDEMVEKGLLIRKDANTVYLADWENYIYHFN